MFWGLEGLVSYKRVSYNKTKTVYHVGVRVEGENVIYLPKDWCVFQNLLSWIPQDPGPEKPLINMQNKQCWCMMTYLGLTHSVDSLKGFIRVVLCIEHSVALLYCDDTEYAPFFIQRHRNIG